MLETLINHNEIKDAVVDAQAFSIQTVTRIVMPQTQDAKLPRLLRQALEYDIKDLATILDWFIKSPENEKIVELPVAQLLRVMDVLQTVWLVNFQYDYF